MFKLSPAVERIIELDESGIDWLREPEKYAEEIKAFTHLESDRPFVEAVYDGYIDPSYLVADFDREVDTLTIAELRELEELYEQVDFYY